MEGPTMGKDSLLGNATRYMPIARYVVTIVKC